MMSDRSSVPGGWRLWVAEGFGAGKLRPGPGTWGSVVGLLWTYLLLVPSTPWIYLLGSMIGVWLSVQLSGHAERVLGTSDPSSVVIDEIAAMPFCFLPWLWHFRTETGNFPSPIDLIHGGSGFLCPVVFALFRLFDIWKPWPIRQSQELPGGWGVTVDDVLAAAFVAVLLGFWQTAFPSGIPLRFH